MVYGQARFRTFCWDLEILVVYLSLIHIFSRLTLALAGENVELLAVRERDESLESYYVGLVGGGAHE